MVDSPRYGIFVMNFRKVIFDESFDVELIIQVQIKSFYGIEFSSSRFINF